MNSLHYMTDSHQHLLPKDILRVRSILAKCWDSVHSEQQRTGSKRELGNSRCCSRLSELGTRIHERPTTASHFGPSTFARLNLAPELTYEVLLLLLCCWYIDGWSRDRCAPTTYSSEASDGAAAMFSDRVFANRDQMLVLASPLCVNTDQPAV